MHHLQRLHLHDGSACQHDAPRCRGSRARCARARRAWPASPRSHVRASARSRFFCAEGAATASCRSSRSRRPARPGPPRPPGCAEAKSPANPVDGGPRNRPSQGHGPRPRKHSQSPKASPTGTPGQRRGPANHTALRQVVARQSQHGGDRHQGNGTAGRWPHPPAAAAIYAATGRRRAAGQGAQVDGGHERRGHLRRTGGRTTVSPVPWSERQQQRTRRRRRMTSSTDAVSWPAL